MLHATHRSIVPPNGLPIYLKAHRKPGLTLQCAINRSFPAPYYFVMRNLVAQAERSSARFIMKYPLEAQ